MKSNDSHKRKKKRKVTWRTLAPGPKLGPKIFTFPEKAAPHMKKWAPKQSLEKGSCLEGVKTLKVMAITTLWAVFYRARGSQKGGQIEEKMGQDCTEGFKK